MRGVIGVVLGAGCAAVIACGASRPQMAAAPAAQDMRGQEPHAEIEALDRQIAEELARAQVSPPAIATCTGAACAEAMSQPFATPSAADPACHPASSDACTDACTVSSSICRNQQRICDLATQLAGDDWAANKCESARASCQAAHERCCRCVL